MNMTDYLREIEFAATQLLNAVWEERNRLSAVQREIQSLSKVVETEYQKADAWAMNAEDPDDVAMAAGVYWNNYFGSDKELYHKDKARVDLENQVLAHSFSIASLAGALLQHAKQGISLVHGGITACPNGRAIGSQDLKTVIWQGRNQAIHWEEGSLRPPVVQCFQTLQTEVDAKFGQYATRSMASDVVDMLGWTGFDKFKADLLSLA